MYYKVKYPNWENTVTVNHQPGYITQGGWEFEKNQSRYKYDMGKLGTFYYHCQQMPDDSYRLRTIERCQPGENPGQGDLQWTFVYDSQNRLQYIHNGTNLSDPNTPNCATKYYVYEWNANESNVSYYTRDSVGQSWQIQRNWQLEFDEDLRAIKYRAGCDSGCGSQSGSFEHVEYAYFSTEEDFESGNEDYIAKRYNANGIQIENNTYEILEYGDYESAGWINVVNSGLRLIMYRLIIVLN